MLVCLILNAFCQGVGFAGSSQTVSSIRSVASPALTISQLALLLPLTLQGRQHNSVTALNERVIVLSQLSDLFASWISSAEFSIPVCHAWSYSDALGLWTGPIFSVLSFVEVALSVFGWKRCW